MQKFIEYVNNLKRKINVNKKDVLFICIGTKEILGDSIGPRVGTYLIKKIGKEKVIGDIENNICSNIDLINHYSKMKDKFIVAIDSAISNEKLDGEIFITESPIVMGQSLNKNKGIIGDIGIKVAISNLNFIDKSYVELISRQVGQGIYFWYKN